MVVAALEEAVFDKGLPVCLRVVAWARLVKVFGVLRSDDLQRITPKDVTMQEGGMAARLQRTKTSGTGKRVKDLTLYVPEKAWLQSEGWLAEGHRLWAEAAPWPRDYFLPRPAADLGTFVQRVAEPADLAALNVRILEELVVPKVAAVRGGLGSTGAGVKQRRLGENLVRAWTGHSERATLASGLAAMGVTGRSGPPRQVVRGGIRHVRGYRALVRKLLAQYVSKVRSENGFVDLDEEDAILDLRRVFGMRCIDVDKAENELRTLIKGAKDFFAGFAGFAQAGAWETTACMEQKSEIAKVDLTEGAGLEVDEGEESDQDYKFIVALARRGKQSTLHSTERMVAGGLSRCPLGPTRFCRVPTHLLHLPTTADAGIVGGRQP